VIKEKETEDVLDRDTTKQLAIFVANMDGTDDDDRPTGVVDSGANSGLIPRSIAVQLQLLIQPEVEAYGIRFGDDVVLTVTHSVYGAGFITKLAVLDEAAVVLFPIKEWIKRGLRIMFEQKRMLVLPPYGERILYQCKIDPSTDLYMGDVVELLQLPREQLTTKESRIDSIFGSTTARTARLKRLMTRYSR